MGRLEHEDRGDASISKAAGDWMQGANQAQRECVVHLEVGSGSEGAFGFSPAREGRAGCDEIQAPKERSSASIPHVSFVVFDSMLAKEFPQLMLKRPLSMVFPLTINVRHHIGHAGEANGERGIPVLPSEILLLSIRFVNPTTGNGLHRIHEFGNGNIPRQTNQQVYVIFDSADPQEGTFAVTGNATDVWVQRFSK
jgi:hypothetical protein